MSTGSEGLKRWLSRDVIFTQGLFLQQVDDGGAHVFPKFQSALFPSVHILPQTSDTNRLFCITFDGRIDGSINRRYICFK